MIIFMRIIARVRDYRPANSPQTSQYDGLAPEYPPPRRTGGELPLGRRYAIAMEVALAIPPGKARVPRGSLGPICERYGVGPEYPTKLWKNVKAQMDATREVDLEQQKDWTPVGPHANKGCGAHEHQRRVRR